jgi:hypothetical protein
VYGSNTSYASSTSISDAGADTGVTTHSVVLENLVSCTKYNYKVVSTYFGGATATSSAASFTTSGCTGGATVISQTQSTVDVDSGGTVSLTESSSTVNIVLPAGFSATTTAIDLQVKALSSAVIIDSIGKPSASLSAVGNTIFDIKALINSGATLSSLASPATITLYYTDADVGSLNETGFLIYHYHNSAWESLTGCSVDTAANTVACTTNKFSEFSIFGSAPSAAPSSGSGGVLAIGTSFGQEVLHTAISSTTIVSTSTTSTSTIVTTTFSTTTGTLLAEEIFLTTSIPQVIIESSENSLSSTSAQKIFAPHIVLPKQSAYVFRRTLRFGSWGADVKQLQIFLNNHGYLVAKKGNGSPGHEINYFGVGTKAALMRFQADHAKEILVPQRIKRPTGIFANGSRSYINRMIAEELRK